MGTERAPGQIVTVFRSRLRADAGPDYVTTADLMLTTARSMPGFVDFKSFTADDGERVSIITFDSLPAHRAWRDNPDHQAAQRRGREAFYATYTIQVAECLSVRQFNGGESDLAR